MARHNERDKVRHRSAELTSSLDCSRPHFPRMLTTDRFVSLWHWARHPLSRATLLLKRWFPLRAPVLRLDVGSRCLMGPQREANEDRCYADAHTGLFVVADATGGHAEGERASQAVIEVVASRLGELCNAVQVTTPMLAEGMREAIYAANQELIDLAHAEVELNELGSTALVAVVRYNRLLLCGVGDSRAYLLRQNDLLQLTTDDTLVQQLVSSGALTTGEAARHPMRHVLSHRVGTRKLDKSLRVESHRLRAGDRLLFATDGLTDAISADEIRVVLRDHVGPRQAALALTNVARQAGSPDNMTCIVVDLTR